MGNILRRAYEGFFGIGDAATTVPTMDGALKPNNVLEDAEVVFEDPGLEDLVPGSDGCVLAACGNRVLRIDVTRAGPVATDTVAETDQTIQAIAAAGDGIAIATEGGVSLHRTTGDRVRIEGTDGSALTGVNALAMDNTGALIISQGSTRNAYAQWSRDLLQRRSSGRVVRHDPATRKIETVASGLGYCFGVAAGAEGQLYAAESWQHRVVRVTAGSPDPVAADLPGYPARISRSADGGFWLPVFALRTQLLELVLRDRRFRRQMMEEIEPRYWLAPALSSGNDFHEPMQVGGVRMMGILKPWAPPRSYGLVIRYDADWNPLYSLHSRVGARHHGIVAVAELGENLYVLSKGAGRILRVPLRERTVRASK